MSPVSDLITKVHHFGTNLLGALLMGAHVALLCLAAFNAELLPMPVTVAIFACSICGPFAFDFIWRYYSQPRSTAWRLVYPGSGGAVLFLPIWLVYLGMLIFMASNLAWAALKKV